MILQRRQAFVAGKTTPSLLSLIGKTMAEKSPIEQYHRLAELELEAAATAEDHETKKTHLDQAAVYADLAERNGPEIGIASLSRS